MASVIWRGKKGKGKWYPRWLNADGVWQKKVSSAQTKTEAQRVADELEATAERQRRGREPRRAPDGGGTLDALMEWWLKTYSAGKASYSRNEGWVREHIVASTTCGTRRSRCS